MLKTTLQLIESCHNKIICLEKMIPIKTFQLRIEEIDEIANSNNIWNDPKFAINLMKERDKISDIINNFINFTNDFLFYKEYCNENPSEMDNMNFELNNLYQNLSDFEFKQMMNDPLDNNPVILTINSGAGGIESSNWVNMLLRMYTRYADSNKMKVELLDIKHSDEHSAICIDSVSIRIDGQYAYGFLKGESGVHRLIRNSPFSSGDLRHTSFASVLVNADVEDTINIKVNENDLEITAQTAGGPGGQHSNKVSSAVRLKHIPSGINIFVRNERDQHANRKIAMKMLISKLYELELKKKQDLLNDKINSLSNAAFGYQIRTYTLSPYKIIKDHRTDYETNDADAVLDGNIQNFIISYLQFFKYQQ